MTFRSWPWASHSPNAWEVITVRVRLHFISPPSGGIWIETQTCLDIERWHWLVCGAVKCPDITFAFESSDGIQETFEKMSTWLSFCLLFCTYWDTRVNWKLPQLYDAVKLCRRGVADALQRCPLAAVCERRTQTDRRPPGVSQPGRIYRPFHTAPLGSAPAHIYLSLCPVFVCVCAETYLECTHLCETEKNSMCLVLGSKTTMYIKLHNARMLVVS